MFLIDAVVGDYITEVLQEHLFREVEVSVGCVTGISGKDFGRYCFGIVLKCLIFLFGIR